jgi:hypothetical protein
MSKLKFKDVTKKKVNVAEETVQQQVNRFLKLRFPKVPVKFDTLANIYLRPEQAAKAKRMGHEKGWPDLFVAQPNDLYHGLFIEIKKDGTRLKKLNGDWATPHIEGQAIVLETLRSKGYRAEFCIGFEEVRKLISGYLSKLY